MSNPIKAHPNTIASSRVLVVGGTSGFGAAVVSGVLANGGSVHVSSSNAEKVKARITEFKSLYPEAAAVTGTAADMSNETTIEDNVKLVLEEATKALGGPLDHIVYTAGDAFGAQPLTELDPATYFKGWNVRYLAPLVFAKVIARYPGTYFKVDAASSITLTSGVLSHKPIPGVAHVIGWAGAIEALIRGLAFEMAPIRFNAVSPGAIQTELMDKFGEAAAKSFADGTLRKKIATPAECAEGYLFSMRNAFLTGEVIKVDGGAMLV